MRPATPPPAAIAAAVGAARCSPCRSQRGAAIFDATGAIIAVGHNAQPAPLLCDGSPRCKATCRISAIHAEQAAIFAAGPRARGAQILHIKVVDGQAVATGPPSCIECSKHTLAAGIAQFWLLESDGWLVYEAEDFHLRSLRTSLPRPRATIRARLGSLAARVRAFALAIPRALTYDRET